MGYKIKLKVLFKPQMICLGTYFLYNWTEPVKGLIKESSAVKFECFSSFGEFRFQFILQYCRNLFHLIIYKNPQSAYQVLSLSRLNFKNFEIDTSFTFIFYSFYILSHRLIKNFNDELPIFDSLAYQI